MTEDTLTQCRLVREVAHQEMSDAAGVVTFSEERQTVWIPTKFAEVGKLIGLRTKTPQGRAYWDEGWAVEEVWNTLPAVYVREREQDYKNTRAASDI
jgi:hypothetical protein